MWDDFAEKEKIDRERKKYPAQEILGFRIIGMRVSYIYTPLLIYSFPYSGVPQYYCWRAI